MGMGGRNVVPCGRICATHMQRYSADERPQPRRNKHQSSHKQFSNLQGRGNQKHVHQHKNKPKPATPTRARRNIAKSYGLSSSQGEIGRLDCDPTF